MSHIPTYELDAGKKSLAFFPLSERLPSAVSAAKLPFADGVILSAFEDARLETEDERLLVAVSSAATRLVVATVRALVTTAELARASTALVSQPPCASTY